MRRRQASAASSVSRRGLRSPLRRLLCPPLASLLPLPELRRVPATLGAAAGTKKYPAAAAAAAPLPPEAPTCSWPAEAVAPGRPASPSRRPRSGPAAPASRASQAPALQPTQGEWWGAGGGRLAARAGLGGESGGDRNTTELPRSPSGPRMATSGGGETPARSGSTKTEDSSCRRGPRPGSLAHIVRGTIPGVRPPGFRAPGLPCVSLGRPRRRRPAWAARPVETKRPWRRPRPRPPLAAPPLAFCSLFGEPFRAGGRRGAGRVRDRPVL